MKKVFIYKQSCVRRALDANKIYTYFLKNRYIIVSKPKDADIIIFVACAALNSITENALKIVKKFQRYNKELIVAGCLPEVDKEKLSQIFNGKTIVTKDLEKIDTLFPDNKIKFQEISDANFAFENQDNSKPSGALKNILTKLPLIRKTYIQIKNHIIKYIFGENSFLYWRLIKTRSPYYLNISRGCPRNCSYCGWKKAVGDLKSKPLEKSIEEFKKGLKKNHKNFILNTDDTGAYGQDIGITFPKLLDEMTKIQGDYEIEIRNLSPKWLTLYTDDLKRILKTGKIKHLDIPIQSGNSRILKLMNRYSDTTNIKKSILSLKKIIPDLVINTHIIAGFPTETEQEFKQSLSSIKELEFNAGLIFPFSCKTGSEAELINQKVPKTEVSRRIKYAKRFLKNEGYNVIHLPKLVGYLIFYK